MTDQDASRAPDPSAPVRRGPGAAEGIAARLFGPSALLVWFGVILIAGSLAVTAAALWQLRASLIERAQADLRGLAVSLSGQTLAAIKGVDLALQDVAKEVKARPAQGAVVHRALRSIVDALPQLQNIFVDGADGFTQYSARSQPPVRISAAEQPWFRAHQAGEEGPLITPTSRSKVDGRWAMFFSRRIEADGRFAGVVVANFDPSYLARLYAEIDPGPKGAITLMTRDGVLLARHPWADERIGRVLDRSTLPSALNRAPSGSFRGMSPLDRVDRLYGYAALAEFPLVVVALRDTAVILADWQHEAVIVGGWVVAADAVIAVLIAFLVVQMRRRERSEARFRDFAAAASDWYWETDADLHFTYVSRPGRGQADFPVHDALGRSLRDLVVALPGDHTLSAFEADVSARDFFREFLCQMRTAAGRVWHFNLSGMPRFDQRGRFVGYRGVARDITTVVEERNASARANMRFLYAIEHSTEAFAFWDAEGRFVMCNEHYRQRAGRAARLLVPGIALEQYFWESIRLGDIQAPPGRAAEIHAEIVARHREATGVPLDFECAGRTLRIRVSRTPDGGSLSVSTVVREPESVTPLRPGGDERQRAG